MKKILILFRNLNITAIVVKLYMLLIIVSLSLSVGCSNDTELDDILKKDKPTTIGLKNIRSLSTKFNLNEFCQFYSLFFYEHYSFHYITAETEVEKSKQKRQYEAKIDSIKSKIYSISINADNYSLFKYNSNTNSLTIDFSRIQFDRCNSVPQQELGDLVLLKYLEKQSIHFLPDISCVLSFDSEEHALEFEKFKKEETDLIIYFYIESFNKELGKTGYLLGSEYQEVYEIMNAKVISYELINRQNNKILFTRINN